MKYILGDRTARWLREQVAKDGQYKPAQPMPSRMVRRDVAPVVSQKFHFAYRHEYDSESEEHTVTIGEGVVQIDGRSYVLDGGEVDGLAEGVQFVCVRVAVAGDLATATYEAYASEAEVRAAQDEAAGVGSVDGAWEVLFPLYRIEDYKVTLDIRPLLAYTRKGVTSLNELVGDLVVEADDEGVTVESSTIYAKVDTDDVSGTITVGLSDSPPGEESDSSDGYCNDISDDGDGDEFNDNEISGDGGNQGDSGGGGNDISKWPCNTEET